jgi:hypothetical protein
VWPETGPSRSRVGDVALPGAWPEGFVGGPADRDALLVLSFLETLTPSRLHRLAWREGTAERCLAEVRSGRVTSAGDRAIAFAVDSIAVRHTPADHRQWPWWALGRARRTGERWPVASGRGSPLPEWRW